MSGKAHVGPLSKVELVWAHILSSSIYVAQWCILSNQLEELAFCIIEAARNYTLGLCNAATYERMGATIHRVLKDLVYLWRAHDVLASTLRARSQWSLFSVTNTTPLCLLILMELTPYKRNGSMNLPYKPFCLREENGLKRYLLNSRLTTIIFLRTTCNTTIYGDAKNEKQEKITILFLL